MPGWDGTEKEGPRHAQAHESRGCRSLTLGLVALATAAPPERGEEFIWSIILDQEHDLVAFWNMTREAFCEWEASDFEGDPRSTT